MSDSLTQELLALNQKLLDSIATGDWVAYDNLCDASLTAFEPEAVGQLVQGLKFHKFYFDLGATQELQNTTMCSPHVRILGDVAIVTYVRLIQRSSREVPLTVAFEETRVWHKLANGWKHVHFHRSEITKTRRKGYIT
ncbi:MAG: DUF4440 domain-containing protein [Gemmataceae bacterium]